MTRTERFDPVVQHADKKEQVALQAVATSQSSVELEKGKLNQLQAYRNEYFNRQQHNSCSVVELQEFNRFLAQLDDTITKQVEVIKLRESELAQKRHVWQQSRVSSKAMHKVVEHFQQEEDFEQQRIEQKMMDEFSQRQHKNTK